MRRKFLIAEQGRETASPFFYKNIGNIAALEKETLSKGAFITSAFPPLPNSENKRDRHTTRRELVYKGITLVRYLEIHGLYECPFSALIDDDTCPALGKDITNNPKYADYNLAR